MGELKIESIKNEALKNFAEKADAKYSKENAAASVFEGNGNGIIDTDFEKSAMRGFIQIGLEKGEIKYTDLTSDIMESIGGLNLTKKEQDIYDTQFVEKRFKDLITLYNAEKAKDTESRIPNFQKYLDAVEKQLKSNDKAEWKKPYTKEAFKKLENFARSEARSINFNKIEGTKAETGRGVRKELKAQVGDDKVQKAAIKDLKRATNIGGRHNHYEVRHEELKNISEKEIQKELKNKTLERPEIQAYLKAHKNADGTYNLQALADVIFEKTGYDYLVNRSRQGSLRELDTISSALNKELGSAVNLSDKEVIELIKFVGLKYEKKDHSFKNTIVGGILGMLTGGAGAANAAAKFSANQIVNLHVAAGSSAKQLIDALVTSGINASVTQVGDKVNIAIEQSVLLDRTASKIIEGALMGLGIGVLVGIATDLIIGKDKPFEGECFSTIDYRNDASVVDIESFKKKLANDVSVNKNPAKLETLSAMLDEFAIEAKNKGVADEKQIVKMFLDKIEKNGGSGSTTNCDENLGGRLYNKSIQIPVTEEVTTNTTATDTTTEETGDCDDCDEVYEAPKEEKTPTKPFNVEYGHIWDNIVKAKYPCLVEKYGLKEANLMMRTELCKDENGVLDEAMLKRIRGGWMPKHLELPAEIDGCPYEDNEVKKVFGQELIGGKKKYKGSMGTLGTGRKHTTDATYSTECHPEIVGKGTDKGSAQADYNKKLKAAGLK